MRPVERIIQIFLQILDVFKSNAQPQQPLRTHDLPLRLNTGPVFDQTLGPAETCRPVHDPETRCHGVRLGRRPATSKLSIPPYSPSAICPLATLRPGCDASPG